MQIRKNAHCKRSALDRIRARAQLIQKNKRMFIRTFQDLHNVLHVRRECGKRLFDGLFIPNVSIYRIKHRAFAAFCCRNEHPALRHERKKPHELERHGFSAGVRAGNDERTILLPKPDIHRNDALARDQRMPSANDADIPRPIQLRADAVHLPGKARFRKNKVNLA